METFLYILFFVSCIVMIVSVLLQPGKTDAGALFTSGVSSAAMNPRGTASVLSKLTIGAATTFMLTALLLSLPALTGNVSVLDSQSEDKTSTSATESNSNTENSESDSSTDNEADSVDEDATSEEKTDEVEDKAEDATEEKSEGSE